jgi:hypothetical protein
MVNTTILYQGGSAGFFLYYYFLLSGYFETPTNLHELIDTQFPSSLSTNRRLWKSTEQWPVNDLGTVGNKPKLFLICNPMYSNTVWHQDLAQGTNIILLYTDLHTQLRMAYDKRAYWFTNQSKHDGKVPSSPREIIESGVTWRNEYCDPMLPLIDKTFTVTRYIKLCDFLYDGGTNAQQAFKEHWFSLQSKKAQRLLCK